MLLFQPPPPQQLEPEVWEGVLQNIFPFSCHQPEIHWPEPQELPRALGLSCLSRVIIRQRKIDFFCHMINAEITF